MTWGGMVVIVCMSTFVVIGSCCDVQSLWVSIRMVNVRASSLAAIRAQWMALSDSPYRVSNGLHSISCWLKVGLLGWLVNVYSSHYIHAGNSSSSQSQRGRLWATRGLVPRMKGDNLTTKPGGIMEVALI